MDLNDKIIIITGGTGSWGNELVRQILEKYPGVGEVRIYSRGEHKQVEMHRNFNSPKLKFIIGDIRDKNILNLAMKDVDIVFHLAALKHVPVCEKNSWEAVLTNINGTQNIIETSIENEVKVVVDVSTDKAVDPFNLYGVTKACGEKLMINANQNYHGKNLPKFICIRGGNVIGTNGSVIPLFKNQLRQNNKITVTDPDMTRYLMSTREAIGLIFQALNIAVGGEVFVMRMPGTKLSTICNVMVELFGDENSVIEKIPVRPGEKKHEALVSKHEAPTTKILSDKYFVILPQIIDEKLSEKYNQFESLTLNEFTSENTHLYDEKELIEVLKKERWLWD